MAPDGPFGQGSGGHGEHRSVTRSTPSRIYWLAAGLAITPSLRKLSPARHPIIYLDTRDDREEHLLNDVDALLVGLGNSEGWRA